MGSIQNYRYHISQYLFPVLVRGQAYGILNGVARPFSALATIVTEYASEPAVFMLVASLLILGAAALLMPPKEVVTAAKKSDDQGKIGDEEHNKGEN